MGNKTAQMDIKWERRRSVISSQCRILTQRYVCERNEVIYDQRYEVAYSEVEASIGGMAFVSSCLTLASGWGGTHQRGVALSSKRAPCVIIRNPNTPHMALGQLAKSAAEFAAVAGVVTLAAVTVNAQSADAAIFHFSGSRPSNLGVQYGRYLQACPPSPNCVSSSANVVSF